MPKPTGPQWDAFGAEPVTAKALGILNKTADFADPEDWHSGLIMGDDAREVMRAANIRQWDLSEPANGIREGWTEYSDTVYPHETLHTSQSYLHAPTVLKYMYEGAPEFDPEYEGEEREYRPEVLQTERGTKWINEGHHRLVASRLNKDWRTKVWGGPLLKRRMAQ